MGTTNLATIQKISAINPIEGADRIEVLDILGWKCVAKKGDFKVDELVVFIEPDTIIPSEPWNIFLHDKEDYKAPIRIKVRKFRRQVSHGICFHLSILENKGWFPQVPLGDATIGEDVTEILGIKKYEIYVPAQLAGKIKGNFPSFLKKTDSENLQSYPKVLNEIEGKDVSITLKIDGTSATFYVKDGQFGVCSRNLEQQECVSVYWDMVAKYGIKEKLLALNRNIAISGEIYGMGIQKNKLGLSDVQFAAFDIWDITTNKYLDFDEQQQILKDLAIPSVPILYRGKFENRSLDELKALSNGQKYDNGETAEGIVVRPTINETSHYLKGRLAFKVKSSQFELKWDL